MREIDDYEHEELLALDVAASPYFRDFIEDDEYEVVDMGDGTAAQTVAIAKLTDVARRAFSKIAAGFTGGVDHAREAICEDFDFCEKLRKYGKLETAKLLASWLGGAVAAGVLALSLDPSFLGLLAVMLTFYFLRDFCACHNSGKP